MGASWKGGTVTKVPTGGRNHTGQITVRHHGGGVKRKLRKITWVLPGKQRYEVEAIEYDPNRTAYLALVRSEKTKERAYTLATEGMEVGGSIYSVEGGSDWSEDESQEFMKRLEKRWEEQGYGVPSWMVPLGWVPMGMEVCNINGKWIRSGGSGGKILEKREGRVLVAMPSGEVRWMKADWMAQMGIPQTNMKAGQPIGKAGIARRRGIRPSVRGVAMNPVDHPHGGGEGRSSGGRPSVTPWGKPAHGKPTRAKAWHPWVVTPRQRAWQKKKA